MKIGRGFVFIMGLLLFISCGVFGKRPPAKDYYNIFPASNNDNEDAQWASYMYKHLNKRCSQDGGVKLSAGPNEKIVEHLRIILDLDHSLSKDYIIKYDGKRVLLLARDKEKMLWLIYQFMEMLGKDDVRFDVSDLPPSMFNYGEEISGDFAFEYRSIYSPSNNDPEMFPILGIGSIDYDWGIWGHNLQKVVGLEPDNSVYSVINGEIDKDQYCFSSSKLYEAVEKYIIDNFGEHKKHDEIVRFVIMPNDNDLVCLCPSCRAKGNTYTSATPAVTAFVEKLARRFPDFQFFTSSYLTTQELPKHQLPSNVGVLISTMDLPFCVNFRQNDKAQYFIDLFSKWKKICAHIYVWDYSRNFDDYLTPYPFLRIARRRLQFYHEYGVTGVIFNGSGDDYSSFDDVQTYVLSTMLINLNAIVKDNIARYFVQKYPYSGKLLTSYYSLMEQTVIDKNVTLQTYGGIEDAVKGYLNPQEFNSFCNKLDEISKGVSDDERVHLNPLLTALNFTRLELMRIPGAQVDNNAKVQFIENLQGHSAFKNMVNYREANGVIDDYINYIKDHNPVRDNESKNVLYRQNLKHSRLDEGTKPITLLTDGYEGIPYDYHTNWLIFSIDQSLKLFIPAINTPLSLLRIGLLKSKAWHIDLPSSIEVWQGGKKIASAIPQSDNTSPFERNVVQINMEHVKLNTPIELRLIKFKKKFAIDEVELLKK